MYITLLSCPPGCRNWLPDILPRCVTRTVYLDVDLALKTDIRELHDVDFQNKVSKVETNPHEECAKWWQAPWPPSVTHMNKLFI